MELNHNNGLDIYVDNTSFNMGPVKPDEVVPYQFDFKGKGEQIEYIEKGCGCTSAYYDKETNTIQGTLDIAKANGSNGYPTGESSINKYIFVWLNDGQPRFTSNERKEKQLNPKKEWFRLSLTGTVVTD